MFRIGETIRAAAVVRDFSLGEMTLTGNKTSGVLEQTTTDWSEKCELPSVLVLGGAIKIPLSGRWLPQTWKPRWQATGEGPVPG